MKKLIVGMVIGAVITLVIQWAWTQWQLYQWKQGQERQLAFIVENIINRDLRGARFLDMSWSKSSKRVNYAHDKLYDAHVTYERNGQIKSFTMQLGTSGKGWISPPASELEILDDKAEIIHTKKGNVEQMHPPDRR